jgi:hypothetical protein
MTTSNTNTLHGNTCSSCGATGSWLITVPYQAGEPAGRLLIYCDRCRTQRASSLAVAIPLGVLAVDVDAIMFELYRLDLTRSDPDIAANLLDVGGVGWQYAAANLLDPGGPHELVESDLVRKALWVGLYDGYRRLASNPEALRRLLEPARDDYATTGRVPAWCGIDLLRGWAFYLVRMDRLTGGALNAGTSDRAEFDAVLQAIAGHPGERPSHDAEVLH